MNEEEIRCCINIATLDKKLPYKKLLKKMKKEHLVDVCYELLKEHLALLDIKEYIENNNLYEEEYEYNYDEELEYWGTNDNQAKEILLDIVNKALGDDK